MSVVGIVAAKENSSRFPGKNYFVLNGVPLFWHSVQPLLDSTYVDDVYVATNSEVISSYCKNKNVKVIWRGPNCSDNDEPLLSILKYAYQSLSTHYQYLITIMANCPFHTASTVDNALLKIQTGNYNEIRSFNSNGDENGLMVFKSSIIKEHLQISSHIGSINAEAMEIHYESEIETALALKKASKI